MRNAKTYEKYILELCIIVLRLKIVESKLIAISALNTNMYKFENSGMVHIPPFKTFRNHFVFFLALLIDFFESKFRLNTKQ